MSLRAATFVVKLAGQHFVDWHKPVGRPKALPVVTALRLTLCRLRGSAIYQDLPEDVGVGLTTAWEDHQMMVAFLADALGASDEIDLSTLVAGQVCLVDGSLVPTLSWCHRTNLASGKHRRYGVNIRLLVDLPGRLLATSRAFPGSWHDVHCFRKAGWVELLRTSGGGMGDVGYDGEPDVVHTPIKKRPNIDLRDVERGLNRAFARIRVGVEGGSGTSPTGESYPAATAPTRPASTPTSTPPSAYRSSTNSSPTGASPTTGSKQHR